MTRYPYLSVNSLHFIFLPSNNWILLQKFAQVSLQSQDFHFLVSVITAINSHLVWCSTNFHLNPLTSHANEREWSTYQQARTKGSYSQYLKVSVTKSANFAGVKKLKRQADLMLVGVTNVEYSVVLTKCSRTGTHIEWHGVDSEAWARGGSRSNSWEWWRRWRNGIPWPSSAKILQAMLSHGIHVFCCHFIYHVFNPCKDYCYCQQLT